MSDYGVVLVHTTSAALRGEKLLQRADLEVKLIPVPRQLSSDCGISLRIRWEQREAVEAALAKGRLDVAGVHRLE